MPEFKSTDSLTVAVRNGDPSRDREGSRLVAYWRERPCPAPPWVTL